MYKSYSSLFLNLTIIYSTNIWHNLHLPNIFPSVGETALNKENDINETSISGNMAD